MSWRPTTCGRGTCGGGVDVHLRVDAGQLGEGDLAGELDDDVDGVAGGVGAGGLAGVAVDYDWLRRVDGDGGGEKRVDWRDQVAVIEIGLARHIALWLDEEGLDLHSR